MMATGLICSIRRGQFEAGVRGCGLRPIADVAASMGLDWDALEPYGSDKVKVPLGAFPRTAGDAKLVVVTAITPTPAGEGKTTTSIGLTDGLARLGRRPVLTIRQPSLGPLFGRKGGGSGAVGMRERTALFGGEFEAGSTDDGGWRVHATFPIGQMKRRGQTGDTE